jgi:hypothetical protein
MFVRTAIYRSRSNFLGIKQQNRYQVGNTSQVKPMNPLNPEVWMQQLQARVAQLEQENAALRSSETRYRHRLQTLVNHFE